MILKHLFMHIRKLTRVSFAVHVYEQVTSGPQALGAGEGRENPHTILTPLNKTKPLVTKNSSIYGIHYIG